MARVPTYTCPPSPRFSPGYVRCPPCPSGAPWARTTLHAGVHSSLRVTPGGAGRRAETWSGPTPRPDDCRGETETTDPSGEGTGETCGVWGGGRSWPERSGPPPPTVRTVGSCDLEGLATRHPNTSSSLGTGVFEQVLGTRAVWGKGSIWFPKTSFGGLMWTQETLSVSSVMSACGVAQRLFWPKEQAFFRGFSLLASSCHFHHFHSARHSRHR